MLNIHLSLWPLFIIKLFKSNHLKQTRRYTKIITHAGVKARFRKLGQLQVNLEPCVTFFDLSNHCGVGKVLLFSSFLFYASYSKIFYGVFVASEKSVMKKVFFGMSSLLSFRPLLKSTKDKNNNQTKKKNCHKNMKNFQKLL